MERCSYFIEDKALFGSFPTQETVTLLENIGVRFFIDLTDSQECKIIPYSTKYRYIKYPIIDHHIPEDWKSFARFIITVSDIIHNLNKGEKIYIHCKGGHGRSGIVVASIFCYYYSLPSNEALYYTSKYHSNRIEMRDKWRRLGSPQRKCQKDFVYRFFHPLKFFSLEKSDYTIGMHNLSNYKVRIPNVGTFPNAQLAFQYYRSPNNKEYVQNLLQGKFKQELLTESNRDWEENKINYMYTVLEYKFRQHDNLRFNLINTGLRPIIKVSHDTFWGDGYNGSGKNIIGKLLNKLRTQFLVEDFKL